MPRRGKASESGEERPVGRPVWSGSISFGLVTVPVELISAQRRIRPRLRMLSARGNLLHRQYVCPKENKVLADDEIERGYEIEEGRFVVVTEEELERLAPRSSGDIELTRFVDRNAIDPSYFVRSYFVVPSGGQTKAYRLLTEAMEEGARTALASFVMRGKGYAVALFAERGILRAETLRFHDEVRRPDELGLPRPVKADRARVKRVQAALRALAGSSVPERELVDPQAERLLAVAREKYERGEDVVKVAASREPDEEGGAEVIDLIAVLRKRLGEKRGSTRGRGAGARDAKKGGKVETVPPAVRSGSATGTRRTAARGSGRRRAGTRARRGT